MSTHSRARLVISLRHGALVLRWFCHPSPNGFLQPKWTTFHPHSVLPGVSEPSLDSPFDGSANNVGLGAQCAPATNNQRCLPCKGGSHARPKQSRWAPPCASSPFHCCPPQTHCRKTENCKDTILWWKMIRRLVDWLGWWATPCHIVCICLHCTFLCVFPINVGIVWCVSLLCVTHPTQGST